MNATLEMAALAGLFFTTLIGLGWPIAARLALSAPEKLVVTVALSLLGLFAIGWAVYVGPAPNEALGCLPLLAIAGLCWRRAEFWEMCRDGRVRQTAAAQAWVTLWCVGWLATVASYSGGGWAADWYEHWERTRFFLDRAPPDTKFLGQYALTARPPLANVVTAAFVWLTRGEFAHYQLVLTLLGSLAFLPAALLALRWGGARAVAVLAVLLMANPLFVQNATFAWTKLPAAFFVLSALYFFLRANDTPAPPAAAAIFAACLAAGLLTHYSAGPYAVALVIAWFGLGWARRNDPAWRRDTAIAGTIGTLALGAWFGWAVAKLGVPGTFLTNSSVTAAGAHEGSQFAKIALNLGDTIVPHFLRPHDASLVAQSSPWGRLRDWFFQSYQLNLPLAFGSVAWIAIGRELWRARADAAARTRVFWTAWIASVVLLGVAVHGQRDHWGLAHICLQALVLLGLAFLAARWAGLSRGWQRTLVIGAAIDAACGIALHFGVQSFALDRWLGPGRTPEAILTSYNGSAVMNVQAKIQHQLAFFSDALGISVAFPAMLAAAVLLLLAAARPARAQPVLSARSPWLRGALALVASAIALGHLWDAWCAYPLSSWNESRLAPAFALRFGAPLYPPADGGPLSTWTYGPVCPLLNLPATLAGSVAGALEIAGAINLLTLVLPLAIVCLGAKELRAHGWAARLFAIAVLMGLLPTVDLRFQVADHAAIALGLLSCWWLTRDATPSARCLAAAALCCVGSISSKQISVLVPAGQLLFLWHMGARATAKRYTAWLAALGAVVFAVNVVAFGFDPLWVNLVTVPGRWPWGDLRIKLGLYWPWLSGYLVLPLAALWPLRWLGAWPAAGSATDRLLRCAICVSLATLPLGLMALFKIGGATNVVHAWYYLLPPLVLACVISGWPRPSAPRWAAAAVVALATLRLSELSSLPGRPFTAHLVQGERLAREHAGTQWFPLNPLMTFYADRTLYHDEDGIIGRNGARLSLSAATLHRHVPPDLQAIVLPAHQPTSLALALFPEFRARTVDGYWVTYRRTPAGAP